MPALSEKIFNLLVKQGPLSYSQICVELNADEDKVKKETARLTGEQYIKIITNPKEYGTETDPVFGIR